jgi:amidase
MDDSPFASATELATWIRQSRASASELVDAYLARIARYNPSLNAVVTLDEERARKRAQEADAALARNETWGPLHGVPMTLKDGHSVAGMRTTAGFEPLADYVPHEDGTVAARLKAAGAIIVGKTNVPVLLGDFKTDNPIFGRTNNPWDLDRTPGGSSGGAGAAVAAGLVPLEIGSDLSGSIRIPAHFCGVFGLKPTEHRVSLAGHIPELPGSPRSTRVMAVIGPLARHVDDLSLALRVIAGPDGRDTDVPPVPLFPEVAHPSLKDLRIAWAPTFPNVPVARDIRVAIEGLTTELTGLGCHVEERLPEVRFDEQRELLSRMVGFVMGVFQPHSGDAPPLSLADYFTALDRRDYFIRTWEHFFPTWDVLLCPVAMTTAFSHRETGTPLNVDGETVEYWEEISHCTPFSLTGHPAVVIPLGQDREGLPISVQVVGRRWGEERLLAIAKVLAEVTGGYRKPPGYSLKERNSSPTLRPLVRHT